jgi:hypothetical protein
MSPNIIILIFAILLSSCANPPKSDASHLKMRNICCKDIKKISFSTQSKQTHIRYDLKKQKIRKFGTFDSPFIAIEKPQNSRFVQVYSYVNGLFVNNATFVYPLLQIFDDNKQLIAALKPYEAWQSGLPTTLDWHGNFYYKTQFTLPHNAKYLIFYVDSSLVGESVTINWRPSLGGSSYKTIPFTNYAQLGIKFL